MSSPDSRIGLQYRPDIDGLRGIAVLAVVGFHAEAGLLEAGFIGVDVFFVISGYLIAGIVFRALELGTFSLTDFYVRRINRIFPALLVVLVATIAIGWITLFSRELATVGTHVAAGATFVSNLVLRNEAGYFDSATKPLLHLWSLAVEEQFYLIFPGVALLAWRRRWNISVLLAALVAMSFTANLWYVSRGQTVDAFFLPTTRIWEILAGALLFRLGREKALGNPAAWAGGVLLLVSAFLVDTNSLWPGWLAVLPVGGTLLLIAAGPFAFLNRAILSNTSLVGIGLVSYPLYLWHWPLLAFARILADGQRPPLTARLGLVAVSGVLAWATYRWIEAPIRFGPRKRRSALALVPLLAATALIGVALTRGVIDPRVKPQITAEIERAQSDFVFPSAGGFTRAGDAIVVHDIAGETSRTVLFLGDSHAEQYWARMVEVARNSRGTSPRIRFFTYGGCGPLPEVERRGVAHHGGRFKCADFYDAGLQAARSAGVGTVVLAAWWDAHLDEFRHIQGNPRLRLSGNGSAIDSVFSLLERDVGALIANGRRVFIVLSNPAGDAFDPASFLPSRLPFRDRRTTLPVSGAKGPGRNETTMNRLRRIAARTGAVVIDPVEHLCDSVQCRVVDVEGRPIYKDDNHLRSSFVRDRATFMDVVLSAKPTLPVRRP